MAGAEEQAKQLDSVTDVVQEEEVDANKALQAMSALSVADKGTDDPAPVAPSVILKEDVSVLLVFQTLITNVIDSQIDLLVAELDLTREMATTTLVQVATDEGITTRDGHTLVVAALRKLVTS